MQTGPNSLTLQVAGSSTTIAGVRYHNSYSPTPGDTVHCEWFGTDLIVLDKLA